MCNDGIQTRASGKGKQAGFRRGPVVLKTNIRRSVKGAFGVALLTPDECQLHYGVGAGLVAGTGAGGVIGCVSAAGFASVSTEIGGGPTNVA